MITTIKLEQHDLNVIAEKRDADPADVPWPLIIKSLEGSLGHNACQQASYIYFKAESGARYFWKNRYSGKSGWDPDAKIDS